LREERRRLTGPVRIRQSKARQQSHQRERHRRRSPYLG